MVDAGQLLRVGNGRLPAVLENPLGVVAQHRLYRRADIVECQSAVGGKNHVADAFGEHAVALFAVAQRLAGLDLHRHVLAHADDARHQAIGVAGQHLFADVVAAPAAITVAEAQLAVQRLVMAAVALLLAQRLVVRGVLGVQQQLPEAVAHLRQLGTVVAQRLAEVAVAENHALAEHVLHVQLVGHGAHHVRPEAFALQQRQLHLLAAGDVADAEDDCLVIAALLRQAGHQPQVQLATQRRRQAHFQLQQRALLDQRVDQLHADAVAAIASAVDQALPGTFVAVDIQQLAGHLVDLGDLQLQQQRAAQVGVQGQAVLERGAVAQVVAVELAGQAGQVEHTQGHAGAFEDFLIAPAVFLQRPLAAAHVDQGQHWQQGAEQHQQAFAEQRRQQLLLGQLGVEQAAQLPGTVVDEGQHHALQRLVAGIGWGMALQYLAVAAVFQQPQRVAGTIQMEGEGAVIVRRQAQQPVAAALFGGLA
ncbi:hypothetical protein D3C72_884560 [compost metagenome]